MPRTAGSREEVSMPERTRSARPVAGLSALLLAAFAAASPREARATTVVPLEVACPVCGKTFLADTVTSLLPGEPCPYLRNWPGVVFDRIQSCPRCFYSALRSEFSKPLLVGNPAEAQGHISREVFSEILEKT